MKKTITLAALFLFLGVGAFASTPARYNPKTDMHNQVSLIPLHHSRGFAVMVDKALPGKSVVIFYDSDKNVIFTDRLTKGTAAEKKYMLGELDNGKYTVEVYSQGHDVKTNFYIYNKGHKRIVDII